MASVLKKYKSADTSVLYEEPPKSTPPIKKAEPVKAAAPAAPVVKLAEAPKP